MSDDLISREALIEAIKKWLPKDPCGKEQIIEEIVATDLSVSMLMEIEEAPTAYDVDEVCKELEKLTKDECTLHECGIRSERCNVCMARKAVEIARNGGKKE